MLEYQHHIVLRYFICQYVMWAHLLYKTNGRVRSKMRFTVMTKLGKEQNRMVGIKFCWLFWALWSVVHMNNTKYSDSCISHFK